MNKLITIQGFTRYDKSKIWSIHNDYFLNCGLKAWTKGEVPYTGVSNYNEALKKAKLVIENLKNIYNQDQNDNLPIKIIEIGAGMGVFAYNFLTAFEKICESEKLYFYENLEFYFTDFSKKTLEEVQTSKRLKNYEHKIKFIQFDINDSNLENSQLQESAFDVVLANYLLDQLPARVFAKTNNGIIEKYIKLEDKEKTLAKKVKPKKWIKKIKKTYQFRDFDFSSIPPKEQKILEQNFRIDKASTIVYSYGALAAVKSFMKMIKQNGLIICSDFNASNKPGVDIFEPCYYGNSLAQAVNFELICKYFSNSSQKYLLYEDPLQPLHTVILTRPGFQHSLKLSQTYEFVYKKNRLVRMLYKYFKDLYWCFVIFAAILTIYLLYFLFIE